MSGDIFRGKMGALGDFLSSDMFKGMSGATQTSAMGMKASVEATTTALNKNTEAIKAAVKPYEDQIAALKKLLAARKDEANGAVATSKSAFELQKAMAQDYYRAQENNIATAEKTSRLHGATESAIMQTSIDARLAALGEYFDTEKRLIALAATARSKDDQAKLSNASFTAAELVKLYSDVEAKRAALANDGLVAEATVIDEQVKKALALYDVKQKTAKDTEKLADDELASLEETNKGITASDDKLHKNRLSAMTALRQMYGDVLTDEKSYYEATSALIDDQAQQYLETLKKYKGAKEAETIVSRWAEHQKQEEVKKVQSLKIASYDAVAGYEMEAYKVRLFQIEDEGRKVYQLTKDEELARAYVAEANAKAFIRMATDSQGFFDGVRAGLMTLKGDAVTWGGVGAETATTFKRSFGDALGNGIYDLITGNFKGVGPYAAKVADDTLRAFTSKIGEKAANGIADAFAPIWDDTFGGMVKSFETGLGTMLGSAVQWAKDLLVEWGVLSAAKAATNTVTNAVTTAATAAEAATGFIPAAAPFAAAYVAGSIVSAFPETFGIGGGDIQYDPNAAFSPDGLHANYDNLMRTYQTTPWGDSDYAQTVVGEATHWDLLNEIATNKAYGWAPPAGITSYFSQRIIDAIPASAALKWDGYYWQYGDGNAFPTWDDAMSFLSQFNTDDGVNYYGGGGLMTRPSICGEMGPEWAAPTYSPQRESFLESTGVADKLREVLSEARGGGNGESTKIEIYFEGYEVLSAVVDAADKNPRLKARLIR